MLNQREYSAKMSKETFLHGDILFKIKDDIHPYAKEQLLCTRDYVVYKNVMLPCKLQTNFTAREVFGSPATIPVHPQHRSSHPWQRVGEVSIKSI